MPKKERKKVKYESFNNKGKHTKQATDPESYARMLASWAFSRCKLESKWSIARDNWNLWKKDVMPELIAYEGQTWAEIKTAQKNGKSHSKNHNVPVVDLIKEAQDELNKFFETQYDEIFSLRLGGTKRIYGFLEKGILYIVWYDDKHEIYPINK